MAILRTVCRDVDVESVTEKHIRAISVFTLPFRLRTGPYYSFSSPAHPGFEVHFRNHLEIPDGTEFKEILRLAGNDLSNCLTDVFAVTKPVFTNNGVESVKEAMRNGMTVSDVHLKEEGAIGLINRFIVAYYMATSAMHGGSTLRRINFEDIVATQRNVFTFICPPTYSLGAQEIAALCAKGPLFRPGVATPAVMSWQSTTELPKVLVDEIPRCFALQDKFIFYEFYFEAISNMSHNNTVGALLYAVFALEAAHGSLVQDRLAKLIPDGKGDGLAASLLREQGLMTMYQVTPYLFMDASERPTAEMIDECSKGITMRNELAHGLKSKGKYKIRNRSDGEMQKAYSAVIKMARLYMTILEKEHGSTPLLLAHGKG